MQIGQKYINETAPLEFLPLVMVNNESIGKVCSFFHSSPLLENFVHIYCFEHTHTDTHMSSKFCIFF